MCKMLKNGINLSFPTELLMGLCSAVIHLEGCWREAEESLKEAVLQTSITGQTSKLLSKGQILFDSKQNQRSAVVFLSRRSNRFVSVITQAAEEKNGLAFGSHHQTCVTEDRQRTC